MQAQAKSTSAIDGPAIGSQVGARLNLNARELSARNDVDGDAIKTGRHSIAYREGMLGLRSHSASSSAIKTTLFQVSRCISLKAAGLIVDLLTRWLEADWAKKAKKKTQDKSHNLQSVKLTESTESVQAITKRYFNGQGGNPVVKHPTNESLYRWLTVDEVRAIMQVPASYELGPYKTIAGNVMGQGVLVDVFRQIIASVAV